MKKAFTLIELLVAIAIIGIIISVSFVSFSNVRQKARNTQRITDIKLLQKSLEDYYRNEGSYPDSLTPGQSLVGSSSHAVYIATIPQNPAPRNDGNCPDGEYTYSKNGNSYSIDFCISETTNQMNAGSKCAKPQGINDGTCFECGFSSVYYDNQSYRTVLIGNQCWLRDNLNIGTMITSSNTAPCQDVRSGTWSCQIDPDTIEKYCYSNNLSSCTTYGGLYEWAETMNLPYQCNHASFVCNGTTCNSSAYPECNHPDPASTPSQGICPSGWHIPSNSELTALINYLSVDGQGGSGDVNDAGGKLKEAGTTHWSQAVCDNGSSPTATCDSSSFTALPAGIRGIDGSFYQINGYGFIWTSSVSTEESSIILNLDAISAGITPGVSGTNVAGASVRCIKD